MIGTDEDQVTAYLYAVRAALGDLSDQARDELLEDLPEHLAEVLAESGGTLIDRLGPPAEYAAELRASLGYVGSFPDPPPRRAAELWTAALGRLRRADDRLGPVIGYAKLSDFLVLLRPAWWVLRGYLLAMVLAWLLNPGGQSMGLLPRIGGSGIVALVLTAACVIASIWFGRRAFDLAKGPRLGLHAATVILALVGIGGFFTADSSSLYSDQNPAAYTDVSTPTSNIQDVFVYDRQGHLVPGARLFDQDGTPIDLGSPYCSDPNTYDTTHSTQMGYPYCPQLDPFRTPDPAASAGSAAPAPSGSAAPAPSGSAAPAPSGAAARPTVDSPEAPTPR